MEFMDCHKPYITLRQIFKCKSLNYLHRTQKTNEIEATNRCLLIKVGIL